MGTSLNLEALLAIEEVTYGTDPTPTPAANAITHVRGLWPQLGDEYAWPNRRDDVATGTLIEADAAQARGHLVVFDFEAELKGPGVAYSSVTPVRPEIDPLLVACGLSRTHVDTGGSESVTYALQDPPHSSCTIYAYAGGKRMIIVGCRGNAVWTCRAGELTKVRFVMSGLVPNLPTEVAVITPTLDTTESPAAVNMGLSLDPAGADPAWVPSFRELVLDLGNNVTRKDDGNAADGIQAFKIASRQPRLTLTAEEVALTDYNPGTLFQAGTSHTIDATVGDTQYERFDLDINDAPLDVPMRPVDDEGEAGMELVFRLRDCAWVFD